MLFKPVLTQVGEKDAMEFSIFDPPNSLWISRQGDRLLFGSVEPVRLHTLFPDANSGTEEHARQVLDWIREFHETGEVRTNYVIHMTPYEASRAAIFEVPVKVPVFEETGLEINTDFGSRDLVFELRGMPDVIVAALDRYLACYPEIIYDTRVTQQLAPAGLRQVRVTRSRALDMTDAPLDHTEISPC